MINTFASTFENDIETIKKSKNVSYLDSIIIWCEKNKLELEIVGNWIKKFPTLKSKIQIEAELANTIKRDESLMYLEDD